MSSLLGVEPPPEWSVYVSIDSVVKALTPDLERVEHCFVHSDYVTYFYLMGGEDDARRCSAVPHARIRRDGAAVAAGRR